MGFRYGLDYMRRRRGGAAGLNPALAASSATLAVYDWTSPGTMTAGDGGAVVQGASDTIALVPNVKTPGTLDLGQTTGAARPVYNNGAIHDGSDDYLRVPFTANTGPANATLVLVVKTTDTQFMLGGTDSGGQFFGAAEDGNVGATASVSGMTDYFANGALIATAPASRDVVRDAWATGAAVVARIEGADYQDVAISDIRNAYSSGFFITGNCMLIAILNASDGNYAAALALAEAEAARVISALGLA